MAFLTTKISDLAKVLAPGIKEMLKKEIEKQIRVQAESIIQDAVDDFTKIVNATIQDMDFRDYGNPTIKVFLNTKEVK